MAIVAAPIISVVSCGSSLDPKPNPNTKVDINLSQVESVKELFVQINKKINIAMPKSAVKLVAPNLSKLDEPVLNDDQIKQITAYMAGIKDAKINFSFQWGSVTIDFQLTQFTQVILKSLANMPKAADQQANLHNRIAEKMKPNIKFPNIKMLILANQHQ